MNISSREAGTYYMTSDTDSADTETVEQEKDLGVTMDSELIFRQHVAGKVANRNPGIIFGTLTYMCQEKFMHLYNTVVHPHLEYACVIWSSIFQEIIKLHWKMYT